MKVYGYETASTMDYALHCHDVDKSDIPPCGFDGDSFDIDGGGWYWLSYRTAKAALLDQIKDEIHQMRLNLSEAKSIKKADLT